MFAQMTGEILDEPFIIKPKDTLDTAASLECFYEHIAVDTIAKFSKESLMTLQIGKHWTKYYALGSYLPDSIHYQRCHIEGKTFYGRDFYEKQHVRVNNFENIFRNLTNNHIQEQRLIYFDHLISTDSTANFNWELQNDTMTICGYVCHKATVDFRRKKWTVWYSEDIPVDAGPWKFNGLPGLIMGAEDDCGTHQIMMTGIRKAILPCITRENLYLIELSRKKYYERTKSNAVDPRGSLRSSGFSLDNMTRTNHSDRGFFVPMELEFEKP